MSPKPTEVSNTAVAKSPALYVKSSPKQQQQQTNLDFLLSKKRSSTCGTEKSSNLVTPHDQTEYPVNINIKVEDLPSGNATANQHESTNNSEKRNVHSNDVYNFVNRGNKLSDAAKYDLLCNVWKLGETYDFPFVYFNGKKNRFQHRWLSKLNWLVYSAAVNGGFCINCVLFVVRQHIACVSLKD